MKLDKTKRAENGKLLQTGSFEDEKKAGIRKRYDPKGTLYDEGEYIANKKVGAWRTYDSNGRIRKITRHTL